MEHDRKTMETYTPSILRELVFIIFDRLKLIVLIFAAVFLLFFLYAVLTPNTYQASSTFNLILPETFDPLHREAATFDYADRARRTLQAQREFIFSSRVLSQVVEHYYPDTTPGEYTYVLNEIRERLEVSPPEGQTFAESSTFFIIYSDLNPERAAEIASFITNIYIYEYEKLGKERTAYSYSFFVEQTQQLYDEMTEKAEILRDYEAEQALALVEILALDPEKAAASEVGVNVLLNQFQRKYYELTEELVAINAGIDGLEKEMAQHRIPALPPDLEVPGRAIATYRSKVAQLETLMNEMKTQFTEDFVPFGHTKKEFELSITVLREEVQRTIRAKKMSADQIASRIGEVEKVINLLQQRITETAFERSEYQRIQQDYKLARQAYISSKNKSEEARLASAVNQAQQYLTLVDEPRVPRHPVSPNRPMILALGLISAAFLGLGMAITTDYFDHSLKKPQDIEYYFKVPNLGSLPRI